MLRLTRNEEESKGVQAHLRDNNAQKSQSPKRFDEDFSVTKVQSLSVQKSIFTNSIEKNRDHHEEEADTTVSKRQIQTSEQKHRSLGKATHITKAQATTDSSNQLIDQPIAGN